MTGLLAGIPIASAIAGYTWYRRARHQRARHRRIKELYAREIAWDQPEGARVRPIDRPPERLSQYQREMLREKLQDELVLQGYAMTGVPVAAREQMHGWCEHCGTRGTCVVCGQNHERTKV